MKKFLLITAVVTAGFLPQLAFCNAQALVDSMKAVSYYQTKLTYPGMNPVDVNPHLASPSGVGAKAGHTDGDCPFAKDKKVQLSADKILDSDDGGKNKAGTAPAAL